MNKVSINIQAISRPPDTSASTTNFLIFQPKHMLWVLKKNYLDVTVLLKPRTHI